MCTTVVCEKKGHHMHFCGRFSSVLFCVAGSCCRGSIYLLQEHHHHLSSSPAISGGGGGGGVGYGWH